jgi:hypothetical protein
VSRSRDEMNRDEIRRRFDILGERDYLLLVMICVVITTVLVGLV